MNLKRIKLEPIDTLSQVIIFDTEGSIVASDDNLVAVENKSYNIFDDTMFCGMESEFHKLSEGQELTFDCINTDVFGKESQYDFIIRRLSEDKNKFSWIIYDFSKQYEKVFELQQSRNIAEIQAKRLERRNSKLADEKEVIAGLYNKLLNDDSSQYVLVKTDSLLVNVDLNKILYLEAYGDYIKVHTEDDKVYITHNTMKKVEDKLPSGLFFRVHRSHIIALKKITNIEQMSLLIGEKVLPIGRQYKQDLLKKMKQI